VTIHLWLLRGSHAAAHDPISQIDRCEALALWPGTVAWRASDEALASGRSGERAQGSISPASQLDRPASKWPKAYGAAAQGPVQVGAPLGREWAGAAGPAGRPMRSGLSPIYFYFLCLFLFASLSVYLDGLPNWPISKTSCGLLFSPIYFQ
jgi:hypothetical protein